MKQIALIQCCKSKVANGHNIKAVDLYISPLFRMSIKHAFSLNPQAIHILSAKYGLLDLDSIIDDYNETLREMPNIKRQKWANNIIASLAKQYDLQNDIFIIYAGLSYRQFLLPALTHYSIPLAGLSIGKQLQKLKLLINLSKKGFWT